jgi:Beta-propeller repeat/Abnormal spindle-like microcephaly-assoc'd, ASPM-SPD-2-Hydin
MRIKALLFTLLLAVLGPSAFWNRQAEAQSPATANPTATARRATSDYGALAMAFERNQGQTAGPVKFLSRGTGYTAFLMADGMVLSLHPSSAPHGAATSAPSTPSAPRQNTTLQFKLMGASPNPVAVGEDPQPGKINYFIGNDRTKWLTNVTTYARVRYRNVYPGIDLVYYGNPRQLEYDFAVAPGADTSKIQFEIDGASGVGLDAEGNLLLNTANGELHFEKPQVYQESHGTRVPVEGDYVMKDATHIGFQLSAIDPASPTVIDPVLLYSTYLGGNGDDQASGIAVDATGNVYVAGYTDSADFPLATLGSLAAGNTHAFVAKLDPTGSTLIYADYLGGNGDDYGYALTLDAANDVYVTGSTSSSDFPVENAYQPTYPGSFNAFITEISAAGSSLTYSTYFGGNGSDMPAAIALDSSSDILLAGSTSSTNFPVANAYQASASANQGGLFGTYGFLSKFNPAGSELVYSTYLGGNTNVAYPCGASSCWPAPFSAIAGLAVDGSGNAYVGGSTNTYNLPTTTGAYSTTSNAPENNLAGFLSKFDVSGGLTYSTYFDESSGTLTTINAVAVDASGEAYVTGSAASDGSFPATMTDICDPSTAGTACQFGYVAEFASAGTTLVYSTFLGANNSATPVGVSIDASGNAYVLAYTSNDLFQIVNGIENFSNQGDQFLPGNNDLLLVEIYQSGGSGAELLATYFGGSGNDTPGSMFLDSSGNIYVAGATDSSDFPATQGSYQNSLNGNTNAFIAKIGPASAAAIALAPYALQFSGQPLGAASPSEAVVLRNLGSAGVAIASIAANGDFSETSDCDSSVAAAGTCKLVITFTPTAVGPRSGSISIADSAPGSPHIISLSGTGVGSLATLSPLSVTFGTTSVGTASAQQTVTLTDSGNASLGIGGISVSGDFSQSNNCAALLAAGASCQIEVTFNPAAAGTLNGMLTVTDNAATSPQSIALSGAGRIPGAAEIILAPSTLTFSGQMLGASSATQIVTLTNDGGSSASISGVTLTGDFTQTNNCSTLPANGGTCSVAVTFTPRTSGPRTGTLTIANSAGSPETLSITGTGVDFNLASSSNAQTIPSGSSASYSLTVTPVGGSFSNLVQLGCTGLPSGASCNFSPGAVTPGVHTVTATLTISTTTSVAESLPAHSLKGYAALGTWTGFPAFGLFGLVFAGWTKRSKKLVVAAWLVLLIAGTLGMSACAGGTGIAPQPQTQSGSTSYAILVNGTSGNLEHSVPLTLTVQQN